MILSLSIPKRQRGALEILECISNVLPQLLIHAGIKVNLS